VVTEFLNQISMTLQLQSLEDWYRVGASQITKLGGAEFSTFLFPNLVGGRMLAKFGGLGAALSIAYPEKDWDLRKLSQISKKSTQR
jgi:hypothetical protein